MPARFSIFSRGLFLLAGLLPLTFLTGCSLFQEDSEKVGLREMHEHDYAEAAGAFKNKINDDPKAYKSFYYLGVCYDRMGEYQQAIQAYKTGIGVRPQTIEGKYDQETYLNLLDGLSLAIAKSPAASRDAEINTISSTAAASNSPWDYFVLAKISRYGGDADLAMENYNHAYLLDKSNFVIAKEYGLYLKQMNQNNTAREVLTRAGNLNPQDTQVAAALRQLGLSPTPLTPLTRDRSEAGQSPTDSATPASSLEAPRN